jgi:hypothetical protein
MPAYFDNKGQHDRIVAYLIKGENLFAVYDCKGSGTGFVGITDQRVIFYDPTTRLSESHPAMKASFFRRAKLS